MYITINNLKTLIKSNLNLTIIFDYLIGLTGMNFEKEYKIINIIQKINPVILDIGAHKGESIKNFLRFKPKAIIYAFEPNQMLAKQLKKKFKSNNNITIFDSAVSNEKKLNLYIPIINGYPFSGLSSVSKKNIIERLNNFYSFNYKKNIVFKSKKIKTIAIDTLSLKPDLIKIDAEGYEFEIVQTAIKTIKEIKPILIVEFNNKSFEQLNTLLEKLNYSGNIYNEKIMNPLTKINLQILKRIKKESNLVNLIYINNKSNIKNI
jgi:FkbM family methyltransferase